MYNVSTLTRVVRDFTYVILRIALASLIIVLSMVLQPADAIARENSARGQSASSTVHTREFRIESRHTRAGEIVLPVTNRGSFGRGRLGENDDCDIFGESRYPSAEFPRHSQIDYLYAAGLWVGRVIGGVPRVAVTYDEFGTSDFLPLPYPVGMIEQRTTKPILRAPKFSGCVDIAGSADAVSEHDLILSYNDTLYFPTNYTFFDPIGLSVDVSVYAWDEDVLSQTNIIDWQISNGNPDTLYEVYVGLFLDFDVGLYTRVGRAADDVIGAIYSHPSWLGDGFVDSLSLFWAADHDGDPIPSGSGPFGDFPARGVMGVQILHSPQNQPIASWNWWVQDVSPVRDWGPNLVNSQVIFPGGNSGSPRDDRSKYQVMANGEFDYDQLEAAVDHTAQGWRSPSQISGDIADGRDTRCLISFGPFTLPPDSTLNLTVALVGGRRLHNDPLASAQVWNPVVPEPYIDQLNFSDLAKYATWAKWYYDNPGVDSDGDGYAGEFRMYEGDTVYYSGDGIPDYQGPTGPPPPYDMRIKTYADKLIVQWNGYSSEIRRDRFSLHRDFEGYRIYLSNSWALRDFTQLAERDAINFIERRWSALDTTWFATGTPLAVDSLKKLYDSLCLVNHGFAFHPDSFALPETGSAFLLTSVDPSNPSLEDTTFAYFPAIDRNYEPDDRDLYSLDSAGFEVLNVIRKLFPDAQPGDTMWREDGTLFHPYYEYEFAIRGLHPTLPVYFAITAFDHGAPELGIESRESSVLANARIIIPSGLSQAPELGLAKPGVFPNPYSFREDYAGQGWEKATGYYSYDLDRLVSPRKLTFYNLPDECTITIWTLDGDQVARLAHYGNPSFGGASMESWDVRNYDQQAIRTGLYIYSIESESGTHIGKLLILK